MKLENLTIKKFHEGLTNKEFSAKEVTESFYKQIDKANKELNAYLSLNKAEAIKQAEKVDMDLAQGKRLSLLAGAPLAIKDNILISGEKCTAGSLILKDYVAAYDATVIKKLKRHDAIFLGKTNLDEFAMGSSTENSAFGPTGNPKGEGLVPGGSSGGSAAAVSADLALAALGSDTGGSIRQPAAFCEVVGLKTTYGSVSRYGLISMASSLDQIGTFTKNVEDAATLFHAISGFDPKDATSVENIYSEDLLNPSIEKLKGMVVGIPKEYFSEGLNPQIAKKMQEAIEDFKSLGIKFKDISLPHTKYALSCYYIIMPAEVSSNLARFDGMRYASEGSRKEALKDFYVNARTEGFGAEVKRRIILGTFVLSSGHYDAYYAKAQKVRSLIKQDFDEAFKEVDVIFAPTSPIPPFKFGEKTSNPLEMYLSDILTIPVNLAGLPAVSIPPGFQLIGQHWREADILGLGYLYERNRR